MVTTGYRMINKTISLFRFSASNTRNNPAQIWFTNGTSFQNKLFIFCLVVIYEFVISKLQCCYCKPDSHVRTNQAMVTHVTEIHAFNAG